MTYLITIFLSALAGIIVTYYLSIWRYSRSPEAQAKKEEIKELSPEPSQRKVGIPISSLKNKNEASGQKSKSSHPYLKAIIYFMAFSFLISAVAAYINKQTEEDFSGFEPMGQDGVEKTFYTNSITNVRACPSTSCAVIDRLAQNSTYKTDRSLEEEPEWIRIDYTKKATGEAVSGYINKIVLSETRTTQAPSVSSGTAPAQKTTITQKPIITVTQEPTAPAQSAGNPADLQGTWKLAQIAIPDPDTGEYDIRNATADRENYNVIHGSQSCSYGYQNGVILGPNCSSFFADGYTFTGNDGAYDWAIINGALILTVTDSELSVKVGLPLGAKMRWVSSTLPAETAQQPQPVPAPPVTQLTLAIDSYKCSKKEGGYPHMDINATVSGPVGATLRVDGYGVITNLRYRVGSPKWTGIVSDPTCSGYCKTVKRVQGDPSPIPVLLEALMSRSISDPNDLPKERTLGSLRIESQDYQFEKGLKVTFTSCEPDGSSCACELIDS